LIGSDLTFRRIQRRERNEEKKKDVLVDSDITPLANYSVVRTSMMKQSELTPTIR